jgi:hypothetical protein
MNLSRAVIEERAQREIAVQQALAMARAEMQVKMDNVTVVTDQDKVSLFIIYLEDDAYFFPKGFLK